MKTNFFQAIHRLHNTGTWMFNISFGAENEMIVSVMLKGADRVGDKFPLPPMIYTGTPQELDEGILDSLCTPVEQTKNLFASVAEYEKGLAEAKAKLAEKSKNDKASANKAKSEKTGGGAEDESKTKFEEILSQVNKLNADCKYSEALALMPNEQDYPERKAEIEKIRKDLEWKSRQMSLL